VPSRLGSTPILLQLVSNLCPRQLLLSPELRWLGRSCALGDDLGRTLRFAAGASDKIRLAQGPRQPMPCRLCALGHPARTHAAATAGEWVHISPSRYFRVLSRSSGSIRGGWLGFPATKTEVPIVVRRQPDWELNTFDGEQPGGAVLSTLQSCLPPIPTHYKR